MAKNLLIVFYRDGCGYCHKLIQEPFEKTAADCDAEAIFVDATKLADCPLRHLFDPQQGVPQTNLVALTPQNRVVGYLPQPQHSAALRKKQR